LIIGQSRPEMSASAWSPLRHPVFRALWMVTIVSNIGTWMQNVAAAWLMTSLSQSSVLVALVQTATSLPVFFLALPAGRWRMWWTAATAAPHAGLDAADRPAPRRAHVAESDDPLDVVVAYIPARRRRGHETHPRGNRAFRSWCPERICPAPWRSGSVGFNLARAVGPALVVWPSRPPVPAARLC